MSNDKGNGTEYWGILCRTCSQPIAFGTGADREAGVESSNVRPGAIRCASGHNHIYFPRDFQIFKSSVAIPDALIKQTRAAYQAINPMPAELPTAEDGGVVSEEDGGSAARLDKPVEGGPSRSDSGTDLRRERAQTAAKSRWARWAIKKAM